MSRLETSPIQIRCATEEDLGFVLSLVPRLVEFDVPPWRDPEVVRASSEQLLREAVTCQPDGSLVLIAGSAQSGEPLGFVHLETARDLFSGDAQGYVANLAVAAVGEGRGVGRALIEAAEAWTRKQGMRYLGLYVFAGNPGARAFYARLGFVQDSLKLVKKV